MDWLSTSEDMLRRGLSLWLIAHKLGVPERTLRRELIRTGAIHGYLDTDRLARHQRIVANVAAYPNRSFWKWD